MDDQVAQISEENGVPSRDLSEVVAAVSDRARIIEQAYSAIDTLARQVSRAAVFSDFELEVRLREAYKLGIRLRTAYAKEKDFGEATKRDGQVVEDATAEIAGLRH